MKSKVNKQRGGTIIGLIIGLVVGLGIAVVVAVMITKTSTPFTNKLGMTKPPDLPVQITDPNKPLYGNAYKEPPPDRQVMEKPPRVNTETAEEATENSALYPQDVDSEPETVKLSPNLEKNAEKNAEKNTEKNVPVKKAADEKAAFYLQVGAFRDQSDAENVRAKLALLDVESSVSAKSSESDNLYRVRIGPFQSIESMNRMRSKLAENSIDVAVIKTPK
jgi:cell division protein FtsN